MVNPLYFVLLFLIPYILPSFFSSKVY
uniref:Uncharacterized protein n=1 Tax=Musa acuminata subsp. malaccensis TaxID=214687 RepID=A0A804J254_MUSAM